MNVIKKVVIFDLYDTVLKDISFDFDKGIVYLYNTFFKQVCTLNEFKEYANTFIPLYEKRKIDNSEICLIEDEIFSYFEKFGGLRLVNFEELEYAVMNQMQKVTLLDEVRYTLDELHNQGTRMYILSNSIFTGQSNRRLLNDFEILPYFKKVFSSADYRVRKPSSHFYQIAIEEILLTNPQIEKGDILYIGNDYVTDVIGATSAGLDTVWYNVNHLPNSRGVDILDIDDFKQLIEIIH